jgi:hypothetical protein
MGQKMKIVVGALTFIALGMSGADAATLSVLGSFNPGSLMHSVNWVPSVPEPSTWGLMIFGFTLLAQRVRVMRKQQA